MGVVDPHGAQLLVLADASAAEKFAKNSGGFTRCAASCGQAYTQLGSAWSGHRSQDVAFCFTWRSGVRDAPDRPLHRERMHVDIAVRAVLGAQAAADAPVLDDHFQRIAPPDGAHRAAHHAQRIAALAAGGRHQILVEAQAFADQAASRRRARRRRRARSDRSACSVPDPAPAGSAPPSGPAPGTDPAERSGAVASALPVLLPGARAPAVFQAAARTSGNCSIIRWKSSA